MRFWQSFLRSAIDFDPSGEIATAVLSFLFEKIDSREKRLDISIALLLRSDDSFSVDKFTGKE